MPKVNYEKQPFRLCRWNFKKRGSNDVYWCSDREKHVNSDQCMKCFCNTWFHLCNTCKKQILKTELTYVYLPELRTGHICNNCYNGEEKVRYKHSRTEKNIIYDIKKWQELNK